MIGGRVREVAHVLIELLESLGEHLWGSERGQGAVVSAHLGAVVGAHLGRLDEHMHAGRTRTVLPD